MCSPGKGCFSCTYPDCCSGYKDKITPEEKELSAAGLGKNKSSVKVATSTKHKRKTITTNYTIFRRKVNSSLMIKEWNLWMYGEV